MTEREGQKRCYRCAWWALSGGSWGECRRYPPTMVQVSVAEDRIGHDREWVETFPQTMAHQWCGEFLEAVALNATTQTPQTFVWSEERVACAACNGAGAASRWDHLPLTCVDCNGTGYSR